MTSLNNQCEHRDQNIISCDIKLNTAEDKKEHMLSYQQIIQAISGECEKINLSYSKKGDGRLTSAVKEKEYLNLLEVGLKANHPTVRFEHQPAERWWWDCRIQGIPINLKLTTGGTDNAFNKVAIIYSITGTEITKKNMNYNTFFTPLDI